MSDPSNALLKVAGLQGWYGESHVLHGIDFEFRKGEVVTLLGRNGAGKTSTLLAIMGILRKRTGSVTFAGTEIIDKQPRQIARLGVAFCPEERGIFASLSVEENLMLPPRIAEGGLSIERIYYLFPNLYERRNSSQGSKLSGGEQHMLANALGWWQTWQAPNRRLNTPYLNETGRPILVCISSGWSTYGYIDVSENGATWINVARSRYGPTVSTIVPAGHYYRVINSFDTWTELR